MGNRVFYAFSGWGGRRLRCAGGSCGCAQPALRQTNTTYNTDPNYLNLNLVSLPTEVTVKNGPGTVYADTQYGYDENALANCPNITGHDNQNYAGSAPRGNVISVGRCPNPGSCSWLTTTRRTILQATW